MVLDEVEHATRENNRGRKQDACAQQITDDIFQTAVIHVR
jgi:hypothetical protein